MGIFPCCVVTNERLTQEELTAAAMSRRGKAHIFGCGSSRRGASRGVHPSATGLSALESCGCGHIRVTGRKSSPRTTSRLSQRQTVAQWYVPGIRVRARALVFGTVAEEFTIIDIYSARVNASV